MLLRLVEKHKNLSIEIEVALLNRDEESLRE